jgi:hypothetical protein
VKKFVHGETILGNRKVPIDREPVPVNSKNVPLQERIVSCRWRGTDLAENSVVPVDMGRLPVLLTEKLF